MRLRYGLALSVASCVTLGLMPGALRAEDKQPVLTAAATTDEAERLVLAKELIELSNIPQGVQSWKRSIASPSAVGQCACAKEVQAKLGEAWQSAVAQEFDAAQVVSDLTGLTARQLSAGDIKSGVAFRHSKVGMKVSAAEKAHQAESSASNPAEVRARMERATKALATDSERARLIAQIVKENGGVRAYSDAMISISIGAAVGTTAATPPDRPRLSAEEIVAQIEQTRSTIEKSIGPVVYASQAVMLASLSNAELRAYAKELTTPASRRLTAVTNAAFNASLRAQALKVGQRLVKEFNAEKI